MKFVNEVRIRYRHTLSWGLNQNVMQYVNSKDKEKVLKRLERKKNFKLIDVEDVSVAVPSKKDIRSALVGVPGY